MFVFFSSRRRHTRLQGDWSSDVCSSDLTALGCVDDGDSWAIPASWVLGSAPPVKGSGRMCLLADTPGRDQAKIPCSMRPRTRSTSLDPGSVAASCNGV